MRGNWDRFVKAFLGDRHKGEPGILALIVGTMMVVAAVAYASYAANDTYITWRIYYHCALASLLGIGVYHLRAPVFHNSVRIMLGEGVLEEVVYHVFLLGVAVEIFELWGLPVGMGFVVPAVVFGICILGRALLWYATNSRSQLRQALVSLAMVVLSLYVVIVVMPAGAYYLNSFAPLKYVELPRPGVSVILGGDELRLYQTGGVTLSGTVCFYTSDDLAIGFAHSLDSNPVENVARVQSGLDLLDVTIVADTEVGVVIRGIPHPEPRRVLPLGGTADITIGGRAMVYPRGRDPYEVTVQYISSLDDSLHILLKPDTVSQRIMPGDSGSPVVQNGVIIAFANRSPLFNQFYAIVAAEVYDGVKQYLTP